MVQLKTMGPLSARLAAALDLGRHAKLGYRLLRKKLYTEEEMLEAIRKDSKFPEDTP